MGRGVKMLDISQSMSERIIPNLFNNSDVSHARLGAIWSCCCDRFHVCSKIKKADTGIGLAKKIHAHFFN